MRYGSLISNLITAATAFLLAAGASSVQGQDAKKSSSTAPTNTAPAVILRSMSSGQYVFLSNLCYPGKEKPRKPRSVVVLNFMGVDCEPCRTELPIFLKIVREHKDKGVKAFLVSIDPLSKRAELESFIKKLGVDCEVLLDPYMVASKKLGVKGIPRTFVFSKTREIIGYIAGATDDYEKSLRKFLDQAVKQSK